MPATTLSTREGVRIGKVRITVLGAHRGEVVLRIEADEPVAVIRRDGSERPIGSGGKTHERTS